MLKTDISYEVEYAINLADLLNAAEIIGYSLL